MVYRIVNICPGEQMSFCHTYWGFGIGHPVAAARHKTAQHRTG